MARCCLSAAWRTRALAAFEATLEKEPNRLGATIGAARAAEKAGDSGQGAAALRGSCCARARAPIRGGRDRRGARVHREKLGCTDIEGAAGECDEQDGRIRSRRRVRIWAAPSRLRCWSRDWARWSARYRARRAPPGPKCSGRSPWTNGAGARRSGASRPTAAPR